MQRISAVVPPPVRVLPLPGIRLPLRIVPPTLTPTCWSAPGYAGNRRALSGSGPSVDPAQLRAGGCLTEKFHVIVGCLFRPDSAALLIAKEKPMARYLAPLTIFIIQLFIIVDPLAGIPILLAITPNRTREERRTMARRSCTIAFLVIAFFLLAGPAILGYFGIKTSAVLICGGILLFIIALELLYGRVTGTETSSREERLAEKKEDVTVTPFAIPLLAGPGAIATALLFADRAHSPLYLAGLVAGAAVVFAVVYLFLHWAELLAGVIGALGMKIMMRIMGLLLAFIAVQYVIDGVETLWGKSPLSG